MQLIAEVSFLSAKDGGWKRAHQSGVRPQLKLGDVFTSCIVHGRNSDEVFEPGPKYEVMLELPFWDQYKERVYSGMPIQLNEGSRVVAIGVLKEIRLEC